MLAWICPSRTSTEIESGNLFTDTHSDLQSKSIFEDMTRRNIHKENQLALAS